MSDQPLVSIVIPLYNGSNYVEQAILCALQQTYKNIEIIIVNDGSTDGGAGRDIVLRYQDKVRYFEKENGGCASALNYAIKQAQGEFISWLSHDDLYYKEKIEKQIALYKEKGLNPQTTAIASGADLIDGDGNKLFYPISQTDEFLDAKGAYKHLLFRRCFNGCGLLIPKRFFTDYGFFNEDMRFVLDWNLWLKFAVHGANFCVDKRVLVSNRTHGGQVTVKQKELHGKETLQTIEELFTLLKEGKNPFYLQELYYFAYATKRGDYKGMRAYLKENGVKINGVRAFALRVKIQTRKLAKKIYHKIRK